MYTKRWYGIVAALLVFTMLLTACAPTVTAPAAAPAPADSGSEAAAPAATIQIGLVTDVGRVNDRSFNQSAWEGVRAGRRLRWG
jgi:basic membrane protein A